MHALHQQPQQLHSSCWYGMAHGPSHELQYHDLKPVRLDSPYGLAHVLAQGLLRRGLFEGPYG